MLIFVPLDKAGFELFKNWFSEQETHCRIALPDENWFEYATHTPNVFSWTVWQDEHCIAELQLDIDAERIGYIDIVVNPDFRNSGFGKRVIREFLAMPKHPNLRRIEAHIETDNPASLNLFKSVGFKRVKKAEREDGFWVFSYEY